MAAKVYDANEVTVNFAGIDLDSGFADGEFVRIEEEPQFEAVVGSDGEVTRSKSNQNLATVTIILMQSSSGNAAMSVIHNLDRSEGAGAGIGTLLIRDRQGLSVFSSESAWITKMPDESFDRTATSREWILNAVMNPASRVVGGN